MNTYYIVVASTLFITLLSALLSALLFSDYAKRKTLNYLFWGLGLALFALGTFIEALFAAGIYGALLAKFYLLIVAMLVVSLGEGSIMMLKSHAAKYAYSAFAIFSFMLMIYALAYSSIGNIVSNYIVYGVLPLPVVVASSIATFPASLVIIATALLSYLKTHSRKMLSIILGVIVVSIAGTLYIVQFPVLLYYAEALGIVLLWIGFYSGRKK
ncbi:MAG: hypothetical protein ACP5MX_02405 [Candidatus Micrarchaeia archaeon]